MKCNSHFAIVSLSWKVLGPDPVVSRLMMATSICLILMRTSKKQILPTMTSLRWYLKRSKYTQKLHLEHQKLTYFDLLYSNSMCKHSSIPTSILMGLFISGYVASVCTSRSNSLVMSLILRATDTRKKYLKLIISQQTNSMIRPSGIRKKTCLP